MAIIIASMIMTNIGKKHRKSASLIMLYHDLCFKNMLHNIKLTIKIEFFSYKVKVQGN